MTPLNKDQVIVAEVVEVLSSKDILIAHNGELIRVVNETGRVLRAGQKVSLRVQSVNPIGFQIVNHKPEKRNLDVLV